LRSRTALQQQADRGRDGNKTYSTLNPEPMLFDDWYCDFNGKNGAMPPEHRSAVHL
jgi:hypothetical protein